MCETSDNKFTKTKHKKMKHSINVTGQIYFQVKFISTWVIFFNLGCFLG